MKRIVFAALLLSVAACKKDEIQVYKVAKPAEMPAAANPHGAAPHAAAPAAPALPPGMPSGLPDGHPPIGAGAGMMGQLPPEMTAAATASPLSLKWKTPAGWEEKPASGMRRATFVVPGSAGPADLSVIALPGDAGGELPNINRWRGQVGLNPWDEAAFRKAAVKVSSPAGPITVVDLAGGTQRMAAAILTRGGESWFFKLLGPDATVGAALPAFKTFLAGVKPAS